MGSTSGIRRGRGGRPEGALWERLKQAVWLQYGNTCWICGHSGVTDGKRGAIDHVVSFSEAPERAWEVSNLRPVHYNRMPCRTCLRAALERGEKAGYCNELKNVGTVERARAIIRRRTGLRMPGDGPAADSGDWEW